MTLPASDGPAFLLPSSCRFEHAIEIREVVHLAVPASAGMPSELRCARCGYHAFPWVGVEDMTRPGCETWVCFGCSRLFDVKEVMK